MYLIAAFSWTSAESWWAIFQAVIGLGTLVFVHELGHFLVAKWCGVKCEKFYLGFDPPPGKVIQWMFRLKKEFKPFGWTIPAAFFKKKWGETEYGIGIIPLGGYVKMLGQDDNPANAEKEAERIRIAKETPEGEEPGGEPEYEIDPRSYQAKGVFQRMAIISAGVIMNLIFAVIFATIAYSYGVPYTPSEIGGTVPGGPAWTAGIKPGDRILAVGEGKKPNDHLRFRLDLHNDVVMAGSKKEVDILVRRKNGTEETLKLLPTKPTKEIPIATIGVIATSSTQLNKDRPTYSYSPAAKTGKLQGEDRIIAVDGVKITDTYQLQELLAQHQTDPLKLTLERKGKEEGAIAETLQVEIPANHYQRVGLVMETGPISGVQPGSAAEAAGIKAGDEIKSIAGEPFGDPFTLSDRMRKHWGEEIEVVLARQEGEETKDVTVTLTPQAPIILPRDGFSTRLASDDSLGIAFPVLTKVVAVLPESPAAKAGMKAGDKLVQSQFELPEDASEEDQRFIPSKPLDLGPEDPFWVSVFNTLQHIPAGTKLKLTFTRDDKPQDPVTLTPQMSDTVNPDRGLILQGKSEIHTADSFGEALALGGRETWESAMKVVNFLRKLVSNDISPLQLGGPGTIGVVATSFASEGIPRFLIFLTLLSANLAVVNFLPIPVLDGGHMVFLIAEAIRGKPVDEKWVMNFTFLGFLFVVSLMLFVIGLDVVRFSGLGG